MISDVEIENEIRALVAAFLEGMRALARKAVIQNAAQYLEVDIKAAGISTGPAATPPKPGRKAGRAPAPAKVRPAAPARSAPSRKAPARAAAAPSRKKAAPARKAKGAARPAVAPAKGRRVASTRTPAVPAGEKRAEQAGPVNPTSPENAPSGIPENEIAEALLAHVEIEPGQGIDDLALAMGTPAADLQEPIKKLLEENKITEELRQGQTSYYPT